MVLHEDAENAVCAMTKNEIKMEIKWTEVKYSNIIMRNESLKNLILPGYSEGKRNKGKQGITDLTKLIK